MQQGGDLGEIWSMDVRRGLKQGLVICWKKRVTRFTGQENSKRDELFTAVLSADPVMSHSSLFDS